MTLSLSRKIKKSLIFLCLIVLGLLFSFHFTQGEGPEGLMSEAETEITVSAPSLITIMLAGLGNAIIALLTTIFQVLLVVAQIGLDIAVWLLIRVTHPDFISLSYTNPAGNPLLATGWTLVRNLTNMGFVISFAFIGLATALRIKEYQAQKILLPLILMALLVNFTPVILGVIVDASNILMNFLLGEVASFQFIADMWQTQANIFLGQLKAITGTTINYKPLAATITLIIFANTTGFIIFLFVLLFLFRYVAIWILVILSPLAFFSYVLPVTRKIWSQWWNQFLQWCFIGVSMAFFLYLSNHLLIAATEEKIISEASSEAWGFVETFLPYGMITALLIYGLLMSLSTSAVGASYAIKAAKWAGKGALAAEATAVKWTGEAIRGIPRVQRGEEAIRRRLEEMPIISRLVGGPGAFEKERSEIIKKAKEGLEGIRDTPQGNKDIFKRISRLPLTIKDRLERVAGMELLAKRDALPDDAKKFVKEVQQLGGDINLIVSKRPDFAPEIGETIESRLKKIPIPKTRDIQAEAFKNEEVLSKLDIKQIEDIGKKGSRKQQENILNTLATVNARIRKVPRTDASGGWFVKGKAPPGINPDIWDYIADMQQKKKWGTIP